MNGNRISQQAADQKLIDGFNKHGSTIGAIFVDGQSRKPADIVQLVQGRVDSRNKVATTRAAWQAAVAEDKTERADTRDFIVQVRQALLVAFASDVAILADFGLTPRKRKAAKPQVKVDAAKKAEATRAARGTKGKKQRLAIHATPAETAPAPAPAPAPQPKQ